MRNPFTYQCISCKDNRLQLVDNAAQCLNCGLQWGPLHDPFTWKQRLKVWIHNHTIGRRY